MQSERLLILAVTICAVLLVLMLTPPLFARSTSKVIHSFNGKDGISPLAGLIFDTSGNLYGTTSNGGTYTHGAVFKLMPAGNGQWTEKVLHSFNADGKDGYDPVAGVTFDARGNLYGTTYYGGSHGVGAVFELSPSANGNWTERVLYNFCSVSGCSDGEYPSAGVIFDKAGNMYGTTTGDGVHNSGNVFELIQGKKGTWTNKVLHSFNADGKDGVDPFAALIFDNSGSLYGTTYTGGRGFSGTVFALTPVGNGKWTEKVLHSFNYNDGYGPLSGLIFDTSGNLYGTTSLGGRYGSNCGGYGCGNIFELTPVRNGKWTEKVLHSFRPNGKDGFCPVAGLIADVSGNLYGTTNEGGVDNAGTAFELSPTNGGWTEKVLHSFDRTDGSFPSAGVIFDRKGNLYGTTWGGGAHDFGTIFEITP